MKRLADNFFCKPWAIKENHLSGVVEAVEKELAGEKDPDFIDDARAGHRSSADDNFMLVGSKAIIPVHGVMMKRVNHPAVADTLKIMNQFTSALNNDSVEEIILDIDSPGGSADGIDDLAQLIFSARGKKPITAFANGMIASAAYWVGAAADKIIATRTTDIGSIGVYAVLFDMTVAVHNMGIRAEVIKAGKHKATGHPLKTMTEDDKRLVKEHVDTTFNFFKSAVRTQRDLTDEELEQVATGRTFLAEEALRLKLIDGIGQLIFESKSNKASDKNGNNVSVGHAQTVRTDETINKSEEIEMNLKDLKLEALIAERPDLVEEIKSQVTEDVMAETKEANQAAIDEAVESDRVRASKIVAKGNLKEYAGCSDVVQDAVMSGESVDDAESKMKDRRVAKLNTTSEPPAGAPEPEDELTEEQLSKMDIEERCAYLWERDPELRKQFDNLTQFTLYEKHEARQALKK